jgi:hypothetical protein
VPNGFNKTFATGALFYAQRHHPQCIQVYGCAGKANEFESSGNSIDGWLISGKRACKMNGKYFLCLKECCLQNLYFFKCLAKFQRSNT